MEGMAIFVTCNKATREKKQVIRYSIVPWLSHGEW